MPKGWYIEIVVKFLTPPRNSVFRVLNPCIGLITPVDGPLIFLTTIQTELISLRHDGWAIKSVSYGIRNWKPFFPGWLLYLSADYGPHIRMEKTSTIFSSQNESHFQSQNRMIIELDTKLVVIPGSFREPSVP